MKIIIKLMFSVIVLLIINGCCKNCDACVSCGEGLEMANQETTNTVLKNLQIVGATKKEGAPVDNSGSLTFNIKSNRTFGLFDEGFDFTVDSDSEIERLYLRVKRGEAISNDYLDVEFEENQSEINIDTDFSEGLGDGSNISVASYNICYEVRVYDSQGNVSKPRDICFDLLGWMNDPSIARAWELEYYEEISTEKIVERNIGEVYCGDGQVNSCFSLNQKFFTLNDNGTFELQSFSYEYESENSDSDYDRYEEISEGKWIFLENRLYLVVYRDILYKNEDIIKNKELAPGEGIQIEFSEVVLDDTFQPFTMSLVSTADNNLVAVQEKRITEYYRRPRDE